MNPAVSLRVIVGSPASFVGLNSTWSRAPVLLTRGSALVDLTKATTVPHSVSAERRPRDDLDATLAFFRSSGFLEPDVVAVSLVTPDKKRSEPVAVGRDETNDVVIDHPTVSRKHALLVPPAKHGTPWRVVDKGSRNGTRVGSDLAKLSPSAEREVEESVDVIRFGDVCFLFTDQDTFNLLVCEAVAQPWAERIAPPSAKEELLASLMRARESAKTEQTDLGED